MCYLKAFITGTYPRAGPMVRLKGRPGPRDGPAQTSCQGYEAARNDTDVAGRLLGEVPALSPSECCGACEEVAECQGFTYYERTQACYLKADVAGTYPNPGRVSRVRPRPQSATPPPLAVPTCPGYGAPQVGRDLAGELLAEARVPGVEACCSACAAVDGCEGYSYLDEHRTCYLKAHVWGAYNKTGCVAHVRSRKVSRPQDDPAASCQGYGDLLAGTDASGRLLASVHGASSAQCCLECSRTAGCEGFAFLAEHHRCYLKAEVLGTFAKADCVTRVRLPQ